MSKLKKLTVALVSLTMAATMAVSATACKHDVTPDDTGTPSTPTIPSEQSYKITYNLNGHGVKTPEAPAPSNKLPAELPQLADDGNWKFTGWYYDKACTDIAVAGAAIESDTVLYAKWEENIPAATYTVTFDSDGGSAVAAISDIKSGSTIQKPANPVLNGYTFLGWYYGNNQSQEFDFAHDAVTSNLTLIAKWKQDGDTPPIPPSTSYKITFHSNKDGIADPEQIVCSGSISNLPSLSADGWIFGGWYKDANCSAENKVAAGDAIDKDLELYANWTKLDGKLKSVSGNNESITILWNGNKNSDPKVEYRPYGSNDANAWKQADSELIRENSGEMRADIVGLSAGDYSVRVKISSSSGFINIDSPVTVSAYDRSGYAHFNYTEGVGAYKDDGTLKEGALVLYVTEENKNTLDYGYVNGEKVDLTPYLWQGNKGIGWILNNRAYDNNASREKYGIQALSFKYGAVAVRIIGKVNAENSSDAKASLINGLTAYSSTDNGGSKGDNGRMARITNAKNLTIEGLGEDAQIFGWGIHFVSNDNLHKYQGSGKGFEVRNITFANYPEDALGMEGTQGTKVDATGSITAGASSPEADLISPVERCWIHNNTFLPGYCADPAESDKGEGDGSCDFKRGQYYTNSYNVYQYCHKTNLVGSSDKSVTYNLTFHHNWWNQCGARMPLIRRANCHFYNNLLTFDQNDKSAKLSDVISARANSYLLSEYNYYDGAKTPVECVSGAVVKSFNDVFYTCWKTNNATIAEARDLKVANSCTFIYRNIDYSDFDTNPALFYYDAANKRSNCLLDDAVTARAKVLMNAGVLGYGASADALNMNENVPEKAVQIGDEGLNIDLQPIGKGKTKTVVSNIVFSANNGWSDGLKIRGQGITFTLAAEAQITVATTSTGDNSPELVGSDGRLYLDSFTGEKTVILPAGTYFIASGMKDKDTYITKLSFSNTAGSAKARIEAFKEAVGALPVADGVTLSSASLIKEAAQAYSALRPEDAAQLENELIKYDAAVKKYNGLLVADAIAKIDAIGTVTKDSYAKITAAQEAYDKVPAGLKAEVTNYSVLTSALTQFADFAAQSVIDMIDALTAVSETSVTDEARLAYEAAEKAYNALEDGDEETESQKSKVTNYAKLKDGLKAIEQFEILQDFKEILASVNADGSVTLSEGAQLKTAYGNLTEAQKNSLTAEEKAAYDAAMEKYTQAASQTKVAIFTKSDTTLASDAGFTVNGKKGYKGTSDTFEYDGKTYSAPLKIQSGDTVTFSTAATMNVIIKLHEGGKQTIKLDGVTYTATNGIIEIKDVAAGNHEIGREGEAWLCYVELSPAA